MPGAHSKAGVNENAGALDVHLRPADIEKLDAIAERTAGNRYEPPMMELLNK